MSQERKYTEFLAYLDAERPMPGAPIIQMNDGQSCIPQHFLEYQHDRQSVEQIIDDIEFSKKYPIFVCEDETGIYIQIGIIGHDNYGVRTEDTPLKIVYGRKWRVEPNLPSSEIIQTAFLAVKKAREHEIRELLRLTSRISNKKSTPFSGHHDIPFIARKMITKQSMRCTEANNKCKHIIQNMLDHITFDHRHFKLTGLEKRKNGKFILDIKLLSAAKHHEDQSDLPEFSSIDLDIIVESLDQNTIYHMIMSELVHTGDRYVDEKFTYRGFKRFSWATDVEEIGEISIAMRDKKKIEESGFNTNFQGVNYEVDSTRVPILHHSPLTEKVIQDIEQFGSLAGQLPRRVQAKRA